jgi:uncharacterized protein YceK
MQRFIMNGCFVLVLGLVLLVSGCASYYKVRDPQTGDVYYTKKIDNLRGGALKLKDARTGSMVTIQNSEVKEISSDEYKAGLAAPVAAPAAAPAAAPVAAPAPTAAPTAAPASVPTEAPRSAPSGT